MIITPKGYRYLQVISQYNDAPKKISYKSSAIKKQELCLCLKFIGKENKNKTETKRRFPSFGQERVVCNHKTA